MHGRGAFVTDMFDLQAMLILEHLAENVPDRADTAGAIADRLFLLLDPADEFFDTFCRYGRMQYEHVGHRAYIRNVIKALDRIVRRFIQHEWRNGYRRAVGKQQRITIRRRARRFGSTNRAPGTPLVVHHDGLAEFLLQRPRHEPRHHIARSAGGKGDNHAYRLGGPGLGRRQSGGSGNTDGREEKRITTPFHDRSPLQKTAGAINYRGKWNKPMGCTAAAHGNAHRHPRCRTATAHGR